MRRALCDAHGAGYNSADICSIGSFMVNSSTSLSHQFYRDLAEIRGYWASYGAKELNISSISYSYNHYSIDVERIDNYSWEWNLSIPVGESSGYR